VAKSLRGPKSSRLTLRKLQSELQRLRSRVEDLEDLRDLDDAIERNQGKPGTPWEQVEEEPGRRDPIRYPPAFDFPCRATASIAAFTFSGSPR